MPPIWLMWTRNEVDEPVDDEPSPLVWVVEQLAHGQRRRTLPADGGEPLDVLRCQGVLQEQQSVGFDVGGELHGVDRSEPFVHIVQQFDCGPELGADVVDHGQCGAGVFSGIEIGARPDAGRLMQITSAAPVAAHLNPDAAITLVDEPPGVVGHLLRVASIGVGVHPGRPPVAAAEQLVDGHPGPLAFDVPQGLVDPGDGVVQHRTVAPVAVHHHHPPQLLDPVDVASDEEGCNVAFEGGLHSEDALGEGGAAHAVEPWFGRVDSHDGQT